MSRITLAVAVAVAALSFVGSASAQQHFSARSLQDARVGTSKPELIAQQRYSQRVTSSLRGSWRVAPRHATCWSHVAWARVCDRARRRLIAHRWLLRVASLRMAKLYPKPVAPVMVDGAEFECIHEHEGAWTSNTGNGYYGGLQMDDGFMRSYGSEFVARWGTADNWPVWAQVTAARRARDSGRGYAPWPNTARACGQL